jgi:hypothetical protein
MPKTRFICPMSWLVGIQELVLTNKLQLVKERED